MLVCVKLIQRNAVSCGLAVIQPDSTILVMNYLQAELATNNG